MSGADPFYICNVACGRRVMSRQRPSTHRSKLEGTMEGRATLFGCRPAGSRASAWGGHLLLAALLLVVPLLTAPPAHAQHIAISEINTGGLGRDWVKQFLEIANLGDQPWNPNNYWLLRTNGSDEVFVR